MTLFIQQNVCRTAYAIKHAIVTASVLLCLATTSSYAQNVSLNDLKSTPIPNSQYAQVQAIKTINQVVDKEHFKTVELDDRISKETLENYFEGLDPAKIYFLQQDIDEFNKHQTKFDDYIKNGNPRPAFAIFQVYRKRVEERVKYALERLQQPFDFTVDEEILVDRSDATWASDEDELNALWRKRIKNDVLGLRLSKKTREKIIETLEKRYLHIARVARQFKPNDVLQVFVNAYVTTIEPHTFYYTPEDVDNFNIQMGLSLEGIGAVLQTDNEYTQVVRIIPGGPADLSNKLNPDDRIVSVAQGDEELVDTIGWSVEDVAKIIRGKKATKVRLEVLSGVDGLDGESEIISLIRDKIKLEEEEAKKDIIELEVDGKEMRIGVIDLPSFYVDFQGRDQGKKDYKRTTTDVKKLLKELQDENIDGLIIDLRNNGGGGLDESVEMAGLFIADGPVVQIEYASKQIVVNYDNNPKVFYDGPLAVLVNRYSASASEIFAGAIQDYNRGIIIGEPTYGKGTVQSIVALNQRGNTERELGNLKITIAQFFRVNGDSTQNRGITPDIIWDLERNTEDFGEKSLDNTIEWRQLPPATFVKYQDKINPELLTAVNEKHLERIKTDPHFNFAKKMNALNDTVKGKKYFSLMEKERKKERTKRNEARLSIENEKKIALGETPYEDFDTFNEQKKEESKKQRRKKKQDRPLDDFVKEAGRILADITTVSPTKQVVENNN